MDYTSILGIDTASQKLDVCLLSGEERLRHCQIKYSEKDLNRFLADNPGIVPGRCLVGIESTGDYHLKAVKYFLKNKFAVKIINPILTKQWTRTTIRGAKTDKKDAEIICKLIKEGYGDLANLKEITNKEKELLRMARTITKHTSALKLRLQSARRKALDTKSVEYKLASIISQMENLTAEIIEEATINRTSNEKLIDTIPGFAVKLSAIVNHEIGDINRFPNSKALVAYAGLDPKIKQSGDKLNTTGRITKRGSTYLRESLFLAANVARRYDAELAEYYQKKKSESRSHKEILCMISRKLLARIYAVLKEQRPYINK